jgi:hypothetical protein
MRFNQLATTNVQKKNYGIANVSEGIKIHNMTRELLSNGYAVTSVRQLFQSIMDAN